jgi:NitT/TauT family transport system permease protein
VIYTLLVALNSLPKVALAPLFVIRLGTGIESKLPSR